MPSSNSNSGRRRIDPDESRSSQGRSRASSGASGRARSTSHSQPRQGSGGASRPGTRRDADSVLAASRSGASQRRRAVRSDEPSDAPRGESQRRRPRTDDAAPQRDRSRGGAHSRVRVDFHDDDRGWPGSPRHSASVRAGDRRDPYDSRDAYDERDRPRASRARDPYDERDYRDGRSGGRGSQPAGSRGRDEGGRRPAGHAAHGHAGQTRGAVASFAKRIKKSNVPVVPIVAFVALAAVGLIAAGLNSGPSYEAILSIPGEPATAAAAEAQSDEGAGGDEGSQADAQDGASQAESGADGSQLEIEDADGGSLLVARADGSSGIDMAAIPGGDEVSTFSAAGAAGPSVSQEALEPVRTAYAQLTDGGIDGGFVFMNLENGLGIAAGADQKVYGASSIKGPFITYVCEELIDGDEITRDTSCATMTESFRSNGKADVGSLIESTITQSTNGTFGGLREAYGGSDYASWLESLGVDPDIHEGGDWYAWYSARDAAKLWNEVYSYFGENTETSEWLHGLMGDTNVSYIRSGADMLKTQLVEQEWSMPAMQASPTKTIKTTADSVSGYKSLTTVLDEVQVANKAGWCVSDAGSSVDYDSTSDNAIVTIDGTDYLMCIMTGAPYSERSAERVASMAASLMSVYSQLDA